MSKYERRVIYIFLILIIVLSVIFIYKIDKSEKTLYNEIYSESQEILEDIDNNEVGINNQNKKNIKENEKSLETAQMTTGRVTAFLQINKIGLFYPVVEKTTMESMKVTLTK